MLVKKKMLGLMLAAAMVLTSPMLVYADNGGNFAGSRDSFQGGHEWRHGKHHLMARVLNLTEDQQKQLKSIKQKQRETMKSSFEQIKSNREELNAEIVKAAPDMNKINDLQAQLKTIQSQLVDEHLNSILAIKKIMTPEQFAGYMALKKARELTMHEGRDKFDHKDGFGKGDRPHGPESQE